MSYIPQENRILAEIINRETGDVGEMLQVLIKDEHEKKVDKRALLNKAIKEANERAEETK